MRETATKWLSYIADGMPDDIVVRIKEPGAVELYVASIDGDSDDFRVWKDSGNPWREDEDSVWERLDEAIHEGGQVDWIAVEAVPSSDDEPTVETA